MLISTGEATVHTLRSKHKSLFATIFTIAMVPTWACSGKQPDGDKIADAGSVDDDDDTAVAQAVPMALLGTDYLAQVTSSFGSTADSDGYTSTTNETPTPNPEVDQYAIAKATLEASARAAGQSKILLDGVQSTLLAVFGANGYFRGKDVTFKKGQTERLFKVEGSADVAYIGVRLNPSTSTYKFGVDLYRPVQEGYAQRATAIDFTPQASGMVDTASVHVQHAGRQTDGSIQRIETTYDTSVFKIATVFGPEVANAGAPAKTSMHVAYDETSSILDVQGGYVWQRTPETPATAVPIYYTPKTGDVELFMMRARKTGNGEAAQKLAYVTAEETATVGFNPGATVFDQYGYARLVREYLLRVVRQPQLNADCSTMGQTFKNAFSGQTVPAAISSLPVDLCSANAALSSDALWSAIETVCGTSAEIQIPVRSPAGATQTVLVGMCAMYDERGFLSNPQYFTTSGGQRVLVQSPSGITTGHQTVLNEMNALSFADIWALQDTAWAPLPSRAAADFAAAEARPE